MTTLCLDCSRPTKIGPRCTTCTRARRRAKGSSTQRGYGPAYQRARAELLSVELRCHWCGAPATTADHDPPLATAPSPAQWQGTLRPSCATCNARRGGTTRKAK